MKNALPRRLLRLALLALAPSALAACDNPNTPRGASTRIAVVVNSVDNSLTLIPVDSATPQVRSVGLGSVSASPVTVAARKGIAVVPEGIYPFAMLVDLRLGVVAPVALPANSGATGVAFLNDSIAIVGNSNRNTVTPVNVVRATAGAEVAVGVYPQAVVEGTDGRVFVLNGNLVNFAPAGPGTVTVIDAAGHGAGTVQLSGINPAAGVVLGGKLYVINSGTFGGNNSSLSVVNLATLAEERVVGGFGAFPGAIAAGPDGNVYVGVYGSGIVVWNPTTLTFVRSIGNPVVPGGAPPVSSLGFDSAGRLHTTNPGDCSSAGKEYRLVALAVDRTAATGICPFAITFAEVQLGN
ncbi:MAG TPA: hypothetical protein VGO40_21070 [Longimicrobium sp.]|jgi:hypothetical protein|nr:hypothetical protein [Longimicrobium sp.]